MINGENSLKLPVIEPIIIDDDNDDLRTTTGIITMGAVCVCE